MAMSRRMGGAVALISGALLPLAFAPFGLYPLSFVSLAILFWLWIDSSPREAAIYGFLFGAGQFGVGVSWVFVAINTFGNAALPLALFLTALFVGTLSLFPALAGYAVAHLRLRLSALSNAALLMFLMPLSWSLFEWIRGWILTGFPWLNLGYSQIDSPLRGWAPIVGIYGLNWLIAIAAGILIWWWLSRVFFNRRALSALFILFASGQLLTFVEWTEPVGTELSVALVQGNIEQQTKWSREGLQQRLNRYSEMTRPLMGKHALIIWPENSISQFYDRLEEFLIQPNGKKCRCAGQ